MVTFAGILIVGATAWASSINLKVDKIAGLEINIQYMQSDLRDIKDMMKKELLKQGKNDE